MSKSLTKTERKLVAQGSSTATRRIKEKGKGARMLGVPIALGAAKAAKAAKAAGVIPSFTIPGVGPTSASALLGLPLCAYYMFAGNPGTWGTVGGLTGIALAAQG